MGRKRYNKCVFGIQPVFALTKRGNLEPDEPGERLGLYQQCELDGEEQLPGGGPE